MLPEIVDDLTLFLDQIPLLLSIVNGLNEIQVGRRRRRARGVDDASDFLPVRIAQAQGFGGAPLLRDGDGFTPIFGGLNEEPLIPGSELLAALRRPSLQ